MPIAVTTSSLVVQNADVFRAAPRLPQLSTRPLTRRYTLAVAFQRQQAQAALCSIRLRRSVVPMVFAGKFYEFHKERIISRPGAPVTTRPGVEVGPEISRADAIQRLRRKQDVYTLARRDAKGLAADAFPGRVAPEFEPPHPPRQPTPSGREDVYYPHFHPGGLHPNDPGGLGHVFYGGRGEGFAS